MAYPIDPKNGFLRAPNPYKHDAFGHDGAVDGCARVRPHSGTDSTPRIANCPAQSVLGGRVVQTGWTIYAGNYVVVDAPDGWLWLDIHLARPTVRTDDRLGEGDQIGIVGNTGGGGTGPLAGKTGNLAIHLHTSRCKDMAAVNRIINGLVRARRKGETAAQWAAAHGLSDPYPHIIASVQDGKASNTVEDDMFSDEDRRDQKAMLKIVGDLMGRMQTANADLAKIVANSEQALALAKDTKTIGQLLRWAVIDDANSARKVLANLSNSVKEIPGAGQLGTVSISDADIDRIAQGFGDRLASKP